MQLAKVRGRNLPNTKQLTPERILLDIQTLCKKHDSQLLVACVDSSARTHDFLHRNSFNWTREPFTRKDTLANGMPAYTRSPLEGHPTPAAHKILAEHIDMALTGLLETGKTAPHGYHRTNSPHRHSGIPDDNYTLFLKICLLSRICGYFPALAACQVCETGRFGCLRTSGAHTLF